VLLRGGGPAGGGLPRDRGIRRVVPAPTPNPSPSLFILDPWGRNDSACYVMLMGQPGPRPPDAHEAPSPRRCPGCQRLRDDHKKDHRGVSRLSRGLVVFFRCTAAVIIQQCREAAGIRRKKTCYDNLSINSHTCLDFFFVSIQRTKKTPARKEVDLAPSLVALFRGAVRRLRRKKITQFPHCDMFVAP